MNIEDVMNYIVDHAAPQLEPRVIADILDSLAYCLDEEVLSQLEELSERWLMGSDELRASIALARTDAFPARTRHELVEILDRVVRNFPRLKAVALGVLERWDAVYGDMA